MSGIALLTSSTPHKACEVSPPTNVEHRNTLTGQNKMCTQKIFPQAIHLDTLISYSKIMCTVIAVMIDSYR